MLFLWLFLSFFSLPDLMFIFSFTACEKKSGRLVLMHFLTRASGEDEDDDLLGDGRDKGVSRG